MKIKINDWNIFEKENKIRFTRDINIDNIVDCFGVVCIKKKIYYLVLMDFYSFKRVILLKKSSNVYIIDNEIEGSICFAENMTYSLFDDDDKQQLIYKYDWIIAYKWIIEDKNFLAAINYSYSLAYEIFKNILTN